MSIVGEKEMPRTSPGTFSAPFQNARRNGKGWGRKGTAPLFFFFLRRCFSIGPGVRRDARISARRAPGEPPLGPFGVANGRRPSTPGGPPTGKNRRGLDWAGTPGRRRAHKKRL
ncbi:uncharacterized protein TM35_000341020 [Trypanosoma theileri]|uniref:Uncharacterized protein n=1 Tax=Trypanosoma theileri TaxID=67003 RepID=A0A1X0NMX0_9TRYP|nr:uncharacterized protein TM35_000341020 [Trypanosoma theileri]ORC85490.1 hypothetical protein TM35_000341020 [Trypanosoma theileri]